MVPGGVLLHHFDGSIVGPLRGQRLDLGRGLGGHVAAQRRARAVSDYCTTPSITHDYDAVIRAESLHAIAAAPVVLGRQPVAVLYAALRTGQQEMGRLLDAVSEEARRLEQELTVAAVLRQLGRVQADDGARQARAAQAARIHEAYARLRNIADDVHEPLLRAKLIETAELLTGDSVGAGHPVHLTERETDVLVLLALGLPNRSIAEHLGIGVHTVKGHLKNLFPKLDATGRLEAVTNGRRLGLIP
ncbi:helix-turn-helix transcriptional regulator [Nocardia carnea]|uniref:helix-turn-helix transcriptional regulator n=1 Tax=Nocardia carnea TaxID=37328 RepID=UPI0024578C33|nr:helix-turn-helix transcriptional regulator [Nocardia carnea]